MTFFLNSISKIPSNSLRLIAPIRYHNVIQAQNLYTTTSLGIDGYLQSRKKTKEQFGDLADKFRNKMSEFVSSSKNMIFTEDLKNITYVAEPTDIDLVLNMIKKFNTQKTEFRFGSFVFGPIVMRMFHFLDAPNEALTCFSDPDNDGFFDQLISFQILLDLLYSHEMYDEMFEVFEKVQKKQVNMTKYPKYVVVLILAACYKQLGLLSITTRWVDGLRLGAGLVWMRVVADQEIQRSLREALSTVGNGLPQTDDNDGDLTINTPQSFKYATQLWSEMISVGTLPVRRSATFMAGLALKQGAPHIALESIAQQKPHYITVRNVKAMALADMDRVDDALPVLRGVLEVDRPEQMDKHTFFEETIERVREGVKRVNNKDITKEFENIEKALRDRRLIDQQTLDQLLTSDISVVVKQKQPLQRMPKMPFARRNTRPNDVIP